MSVLLLNCGTVCLVVGCAGCWVSVCANTSAFAVLCVQAGARMAGAGRRTTCLRCAAEIAAAQETHDSPDCAQCGQSMDIHAIITSESGLAALSVALFKRLQKPRAVMGSRIFVNNILKEQLAKSPKWVQPTWQLIGTTTSRREERTDYLITEWKDV